MNAARGVGPARRRRREDSEAARPRAARAGPRRRRGRSSAREAQRHLAERSFDLFVVDNVMPGMTGLELLREVFATMPDAERPQMVMMTAHGSTQIVREAFKLGVEDFLEKPFEVDELLALARRAVRSRRLQTEKQYLISERDADFNHYGIVGRSRAMQEVHHARRARRGDQEHRADHRRDRHRQGDGGAPDPPSQRAARDAAHQGQLRGDSRHAARIRAVRPRARRVHRRHHDQARQVRARRRRLDLPRRDRHDDRRRSSRSCCACCRSASSSRSAPSARRGWTCA